MEAVKMQNTVPVKARAVNRATAAESMAQNDGFVKLLQEKRDVTETKKPETPKTQDKKTDPESDAKDSVSEKTEEKAEKPGKEEVITEVAGEEDVLLQAMIQQAAAQMTGILSEVQQPVQEIAAQTTEGVVTEENVTPVENSLPEGTALATEVMENKTEAVEQPFSGQAEEKGQDGAYQEEGQNQDNIPVLSRESKPVENEPVVQTGKNGQPTVQEEKAQPEDKVQEPLYNGHSVKEQPEQVFVNHKAEEIPLKTTQADLPQDLGRTLAARLPGSGGELTVELEPANLGKLTIKLVYEGERAAVSIFSSNPKTLELLSEKAAEIASILEEKTGQQTIIYTQPSQQQEDQDPNRNPGGQSRQEKEDRHESREEERHQTESFAQQLRLGLV